jgi:hypothetical protein
MSIKVVIAESFLVASGGITEVETSGKTIDECLKEASKESPGLEHLWFTPDGRLSKFVLLFLNGENVPGNNADQAVVDGDEIYPLLVIGGG